METTIRTPRYNYTQNAQEGQLYDPNMSTSDITKTLRAALKGKFPTCTFSVTKEHHNAIKIALMAAPFVPFTTEESVRVAVNQHHIQDSEHLTTEAKEVLSYAYKVSCAFNFDDSDAGIDYFHTNFYLTMSIGKWNKPFVKTS